MAGVATSTRAEVYRIEDLVALLAAGKLRVPEFQRNFRWGRRDVLDLFDSILKGYPVGSLLLWRHEAPAATVRIGELRVDAPHASDALWVVDGQQRITAIANAVSSDVYTDSETFRIDFDLAHERFVPGGAKTDGPTVPLPVLFNLRKLLEWAQEWPDAAEHIRSANDVAVRLRDFSVPASIVSDSDEGTLREIFDRTNNAGKKLKRAEVFHALFSTSEDSGTSIEAIADDLESTGFGRIDGDTVLHAILARRHPETGRDLRLEFTRDRREILDVPADETQEQAFEGGREALRSAIAFLQNSAGVPHFTFLPYRYLLVTLARFFAHHPKPSSRNIDLLSRWFWRSAVSPTLFRGSATAMARGFAVRVDPQDESKSVQDLLALVPDDFAFIRPDINRFRTNEASTRIVLCALFEASPLRFSNGLPLDIATLADGLGDTQTPLAVVAGVVPRAQIKDPLLAAGVGGRFLLTENDVPLERARAVLSREADLFTDAAMIDRIAHSHLIDDIASNSLRLGEYDQFLRRRRDAIGTLVNAYLETRMGLSLPTNPPLNDFNFDDLDELDPEFTAHNETND